VLSALGAVLGWVAGSVLRIRREHVEGAMRTAGIEQPGQAARAMYRSLGVSAVEFLWMAWVGRRALERVRVDEGSIEAWRGARALGKGVVLAATHTGNWDLAACAIARDVELTVVTKHLSVKWLDRLWQRTRAKQGVALVDAAGALGTARDALRRGGAVAMMIDQVPSASRQAVEVDFLGREALADRAPAALAAAAGAPLVVAASRRLPDGTHRLHVLGVHVPPPRPGPAWVASVTVDATRALDAFVRDHPSQWLWLHRRWKRLDQGSAAAMLASPCSSTTRSSSPAGPSRAA
jgi:KDO2-lipid IV(A) lauroyltransferase